MNPLFRREALETSTTRYGAPIRTYGVRSWVLTLFFLGLLIALIIFVCVARYARKETVTGSLVPSAGFQSLVSPRAGTVDSILAAEGQIVAENDPILSISFETLDNSGQSLAELRRQAADSEAAALDAHRVATADGLQSQLSELRVRLSGITADLDQLGEDESIAQERIRLATESLTAGRTLAERGLMAAAQLRQREEALLVGRRELSGIMREVRNLHSQQRQIHAQRSRLEAERAQATAASTQQFAEHAERRAGLLAQEGQLLTARQSGRLASLWVRPGAAVQPGQTLGVVLPQGSELEAELWVPSRAVGFLKEAGDVRLLYDAFPYQRFGAYQGRIRYISQSPTNPRELPDLANETEPLYRVVVTLTRQSVQAAGRPVQLTPGMRLTADLVLDERPLAVWLLDPILSTRMRGRPPV